MILCIIKNIYSTLGDDFITFFDMHTQSHTFQVPFKKKDPPWSSLRASKIRAATTGCKIIAIEINRKKKPTSLFTEAWSWIKHQCQAINLWNTELSAQAHMRHATPHWARPHWTVGVFNKSPVEPFILLFLPSLCVCVCFAVVCFYSACLVLCLRCCSLTSARGHMRLGYYFTVAAQLSRSSVQIWIKCETYERQLAMRIIWMLLISRLS